MLRLLYLALVSGLPLLAQTGTAQADNFQTLAERANAARESNQLTQAVALYRQALARRPDWAEGWWNLGTLFYEQDAYDEAATALQKAVTLNSNVGIANVMLGLSEAKLGRVQQALGHLETGRKLGIGNHPELRRVILYTEGTLFLSTGDFSRAQQTLGRLARDGSEEEALIMALGRSVLGIRSGDLASDDPATREIIHRAGWAEHLAARREVRAAMREYQSLAAYAPKFHDVQFACGRFLLASHEDDQAVAAFQREIENTPNHLLARLGIAGIKAVSDPAGGLPYAEQAVKIAPHLAEAHYLLGLTVLNTGETKRAMRELEIARNLAPDEAKVYFALGRAYSAEGRTADAVRARATFHRLTELSESRMQSNDEDRTTGTGRSGK